MGWQAGDDDDDNKTITAVCGQTRLSTGRQTLTPLTMTAGFFVVRNALRGETRNQPPCSLLSRKTGREGGREPFLSLPRLPPPCGRHKVSVCRCLVRGVLALSLFVRDGSEELEHPLGAAEVADTIFVRAHYLTRSVTRTCHSTLFLLLIKTERLVACLHTYEEERGPVLVGAPSSLLSNQRRTATSDVGIVYTCVNYPTIAFGLMGASLKTAHLPPRPLLRGNRPTALT